MNNRYSVKKRQITILLSVIVLAFLLAGSVYAIFNFEIGSYFEIIKNPIESVEVSAVGDKNVICGEQVTLSSSVYPTNANLTVIKKEYRIIDGIEYATIEDNILTVSDTAPVGGCIEVISIVDGIESKNSVKFTVVRTPVETVKFKNQETTITVGGVLKLEAEVLPEKATDKQVIYSVVSGSEFMQVTYSGMLSFKNKSVKEDNLSVTVRATSVSDPKVYDELTLDVVQPLVPTETATEGLSEVNQGSAYSFDTKAPYLYEIFGNKAVRYSLDVDSSIATVDVNGLLYITMDAPLGSALTISVDSLDGVHFEQKLVVVPVYATEFTPVVLTEPSLNFNGKEYYLPQTVIEFDVVSFMPVNVTESNKVFALSVSDNNIAYVDGNKVIIRETDRIKMKNPHLTVTVYSEPNGLSKDFEFDIFIPVEEVTASKKMNQLRENYTYSLTSLVDYKVSPSNATVTSLSYSLVDVNENIAVIKNGNVIVKDNLPKGKVTVKLQVELNGVYSNTVEIEVYKPAHSLTVDARLDGEKLTDTYLPISGKNIGDTVTVITQVNEEASANISQITVTHGSEYIDGNVTLDKIENGTAYFKFTLKKNLGSANNCDRNIKLCAYQDGITTDEIEIGFYIPNEDIFIPNETVNRGENLTISEPSNSTKNASNNQWEVVLSTEAKNLGVTKTGNSISFPKKMSAGTQIKVLYRAIETNTRCKNIWKEAVYTIGKIESVANLIYGDPKNHSYESGFNIAYGTDGGTGKDLRIINKDLPQIIVGNIAYVDIRYGQLGELLEEYGLVLGEVKSNNANIDAKRVDNNTISINVKNNAITTDSAKITVTVTDGSEAYTFDAGVIYAFNPLSDSDSISFGIITANKESLYTYLEQKSGIDNLSGGFGALTFTPLSTGDVLEIVGNKIYLKSYAASKEQSVQCVYTSKYNGIDYVHTYSKNIPITFNTVSIDKSEGTGGYDEIIAISGMTDLGSESTLKTIVSSRTGYKFDGFGDYIDTSGVVLKDFNDCGTLVTDWTPIVYYTTFYYIVKDKQGERPVEFSDGTKGDSKQTCYYDEEYTVKEYPVSGCTFSHWEIDGKWYSDSKCPTYENLTAEDGATVKFVGVCNPPSCVATGTQITLADGTQKPVEELDGQEELLVWNFETGEFDSAPILFIDTHGEKEYLVTHLYFEDGTVVDIIDEHGFFDTDLNKYVYITSENFDEYIGHGFNKQYTDENGNLSYTTVRLVNAENEIMITNSYSPVTYKHLSYYVCGMLSVPSDTQGLTNIFEVDKETMKYDQELMQKDIEAYGLMSYEVFENEVPKEIFDAVNGQYLAVSLGKGLTTEDYLKWLIETYSKYFETEDNQQ